MLSPFANFSVGIFVLVVRYGIFQQHVLRTVNFLNSKTRNSLLYMRAETEIISVARGYEFHWSAE